MKISDDVVEAAESLLEHLESHDEVAYGEVGAISQSKCDIAAAGQSIQRSSCISDSGIWCRVFSDGAAGYRYTTNLDNLDNIASFARKRAQVLGQSVPAKYDIVTVNQCSHNGWTINNTNDETSTDTKVEIIERSLNNIDDNIRTYYEDVTREDYILTTTGSHVRTSVDRNWCEAHRKVTLSDGSGIKIRQQNGTTRGIEGPETDLIKNTVSELSDQGSRMSQHPTTNVTGTRSVVLSGSVAAHVFHQFMRYLEMDMIYFGSSPVDIGTKLLSDKINISDTVEPGNWAAIGFDGEGKPTSPTNLIVNGVVVNRLHSTVTALDQNEQPRGNYILSIDPKFPPRIHSRHIDVDPGERCLNDMLEISDIFVVSVGLPEFKNEATEIKQSSRMPPCALYAKDIADQTPNNHRDEQTNQSISFPITEGYILRDGKKESLLVDASLVISLGDLQRVGGVGTRRSTVDGKCTKHNSKIPFSATAPPIRMDLCIA